MKEKVSVIVPIYKVEKYIHRCINSILKQSYEDLEVILVNDGSPDNCGEIINEYEKKDSRVITIHKENGGLSDARNAGMEIVSGEYVIFVDSDDWIEKDFIQRLVTTSKSKQSDIVQTSFYYAYDDYLLYDNRFYNSDSEIISFSNSELMRELVKNDIVKNFAWGKLYKTKLVRDLPFKKGVLFEDVFWAHKVMQRVERYVILHEPMYYYFQRNDSIVAKYTIRNLDILEGLKERHEFIEKHYPYLLHESLVTIFKASLTHYHLILVNRELDRDGKHKKQIETYIRNKHPFLLKALKGDKMLNLQLRLFLIKPYLTLIPLAVMKALRMLKFVPKSKELVKMIIKPREIIKGG
ncbi:glycosyltransferase family 2 protein [Robertmurraya sp. P23]|uniref:glycosyltransferase family 2 protein n=1 Tax=Robertmurraya sp. P23 TaxID=3436931 RepID=UPI003D9741C2